MTNATLQHELKGLARDLRRRRRLRLLVRSTWLALLWLGVGLGVQILHRQPPWLALVVAAGITLLSGLLWSLARNPKLPELARSYDRHFNLQEQLESAWETASHVPSSTIAERLVEQAMISIRQYRAMIRSLPRLPWREVETLVAVMLMIVALALAGGNNRLPAQQPLDLPSLAPPSPDQPQPTDQSVAHDSPSAASNQAAASALAQALAGTDATRPAADALQRGDTAGAAQSLRDQASQTDQLSQAARNTLSQDLQSAAGQIQQNQAQRAGDINRSAQELANNPQQGLQDLAQVVDGLNKGNDSGANAQAAATAGAGQQGAGAGGSLGGNGKRLGGEARSGPSNPPQAAGNTLPLPTSPAGNGPATSATGPKGPTVQLQAGGTSNAPASAGGGGSNDPLPGEADPLRIPPEDRDAVENYFSPAP